MPPVNDLKLWSGAISELVPPRPNRPGDGLRSLRRTSRGLVAALLAAQFLLGLHAAWMKSVTHDEFWHYPVGLLNWRTFDFSHDRLNPPLTRLWAALPAAICGVETTPGVDAGDHGLRFVAGHLDSFHAWYFTGRVMNLCLLLLLSIWAVDLAVRWQGSAAGAWTALFAATEPNLLAHGSLVTPDLGIALAFLATLDMGQRWCEQPSTRRAVALGVAAGAALGAKFTALLLAPWFLWLIVEGMLAGRRVAGQWQAVVRGVGISVLVALFVLNGAYGFRHVGVRLSAESLTSPPMRTIVAMVGPLASIPWPLPRDFVQGLDEQLSIMAGLHPVYLDGDYIASSRNYMLFCLIYKLPHPLQAAACAGVGLVAWAALRHSSERGPRCAIVLGGLVMAAGSSTNMQLGLRYVLPVLPLLLMAAGFAAAKLMKLGKGGRCAALMLAVLSVATWRFHPHHLSYFNEYAGGPADGGLHLIDSNLDWGQDLYLVRDWMRSKNLGQVQLLYFGTLSPESVGVKFELPMGAAMRPGTYVVSENFLRGRPYVLRDGRGGVRKVVPFEFVFFQLFSPTESIGYTTKVFQMSADDVARWNRARIDVRQHIHK